MAKMLSIEVGRSTTKIAEMDFQARKPKIYKCVELKTPEGAVKDGYLVSERMEALRDAIRETLKTNKIRTKRVLFTVFSGKIITREIVLPGVKLYQINAIIESNITEYFPIELEDYKITHMFISTFREGENAGKHKVLVIAAELALLAGYEQLAEDLGLNIVDIDYAGNSAFQAVKQSAGAGAVMAVKVEDENALITIVKQGLLVMQRTVNYNIGRSDDAPVDPEEASRMLVGTVLRVIDFYVSNNEDGRIEQIYILGEGSRNQAIVDMMTAQTQLPCRLLDTVRGVTITKKADDAPKNIYAAVIGSGLGSVGFDAEKERERHETNYVSACVLMLLFFLVMAAALVSFALIPYNSALMEQRALQTKQEQLEPAKLVHDQYIGMKDMYAQVEYGHKLTEHFNDGILDFLAELEEKMPRDVELTDFSSDDEQCIMTMRVVDKETAAGVIKNLREFESLGNVTVESIIEESEDDNDNDSVPFEERETTVSFTVTCKYVVETLTAPVSTAQAQAEAEAAVAAAAAAAEED